MKSNYKIVFLITILILILTLSISVINYQVSLETTKTQLKNQALPLSLDNIYTEIQKSIIEPYLISSMMANDIFVKDWILHDEDNIEKISNYLKIIKEKYSIFLTFLVSEKTKNYYTSKGVIEVLDKNKKENEWYFSFKNKNKINEINLDLNKNLGNSLIMFINHKIIKNNELIGMTGVGLKISYINKMLEMFREKYKLKVSFYNTHGDIVLSEDHNKKNIDLIKNLFKNNKDFLLKQSEMFEYKENGEKIILNNKFIPELNLYLIIEAKVDDFIKDIRHIFYFNLLVSLIITLIITLIILSILRKYNKKLEKLADYDSLTSISNRRKFNDTFKHFFLLSKRKEEPLSVLFLDLDNFKSINDKYGHKVGDKVLIRCAEVLSNNIRKTDLIARWGGEEFVIAFINTKVSDAFVISNKICSALENDDDLIAFTKSKLTASIGLTQCLVDDTIDTVLVRADKAMYDAKSKGKNQVIIV